MKKALLSLIIAATFLVCAMPFSGVLATEGEGFVYTIENGEVTITDYDGQPEGILTVPESIEGYPVTKIDDRALRSHPNMTGVVLPDSLKEIGSAAFMGSGIETINFPSSVEKIGSGILGECKKLKSITVDDDNKYFCADDNGVLYNKDKTKIFRYPAGSGLSSYTIDETVATVSGGAFAYSENLETVIFPSGLKIIENQAFYGCKKLNNISLPTGLEKIGQLAFGETAHYSDDSKWDKDGVLYIGEYLIHNNGKFAGEYAIKDGTTLMATDALAAMPQLTGVTFPESLKSISEYGLASNLNLVNLTIPETIESIDSMAFRFCMKLEKVVIPASVTKIGDQAFDFCESLREVVLSDGLVSIGEAAFQSCRALERITIPQSVTTIEMYAFNSCYKLKDVTLPDTLKHLGEKAFSQTGIKKIIIPKGITKIAPAVFSACNNLEEIVLPDTITGIDDYTFDACSALKTINYYGSEEQWKEIEVSTVSNDYFINAKVNFDYVRSGDVDGSFKINSSDALAILQSTTGLVTLDGNRLAAADVDRDGKVLSKDALAVLQYSTGLITTL